MNIAAILMAQWNGDPVSLRDDYKSRIEHGIWIVEWVKVDGTQATMSCTLDPRIMPLNESEKSPKPVNEDVLAVYSPDRNGWRSFRVLDVKALYPKADVY